MTYLVSPNYFGTKWANVEIFFNYFIGTVQKWMHDAIKWDNKSLIFYTIKWMCNRRYFIFISWCWCCFLFFFIFWSACQVFKCTNNYEPRFSLPFIFSEICLSNIIRLMLLLIKIWRILYWNRKEHVGIIITELLPKKLVFVDKCFYL